MRFRRSNVKATIRFHITQNHSRNDCCQSETEINLRIPKCFGHQGNGKWWLKNLMTCRSMRKTRHVRQNWWRIQFIHTNRKIVNKLVKLTCNWRFFHKLFKKIKKALKILQLSCVVDFSPQNIFSVRHSVSHSQFLNPYLFIHLVIYFTLHLKTYYNITSK